MSPAQTLRDRVISTAAEIVATDGVDALSMREVARRAGVSHQAPYHHFGDREAILAAVAEQGFTVLVNRMTVALRADDTDGGAFARVYISTALEFPGHFRVMFQPGMCDLDRHPAANAAAEQAFALLLEKSRRLGPTSDSDKVVFDRAITMWSFVHGLSTLIMDGPLARKLPQDESLVEIISSAVNYFVSALAAAGAASNRQ